MDYNELTTKLTEQAKLLVEDNLITESTTYKDLTHYFKLFVTSKPVNEFFVDKFMLMCYHYLQLKNK